MTKRSTDHTTPNGKPLKEIPVFASEQEERAFWEARGRDSTKYLDWSKAKNVVLPGLKAERAKPPAEGAG
jgi:hypothetical protein